MTPAVEPAYVATVLMLYVDLTDTPLRPSPQDQCLLADCMSGAFPCRWSNLLCCWRPYAA